MNATPVLCITVGVPAFVYVVIGRDSLENSVWWYRDESGAVVVDNDSGLKSSVLVLFDDGRDDVDDAHTEHVLNLSMHKNIQNTRDILTNSSIVVHISVNIKYTLP